MKKMYIRQPAHAWTFYPAHPQILHQMLMEFSVNIEQLVKIEDVFSSLKFKRAVISPHAGYIYSW